MLVKENCKISRVLPSRAICGIDFGEEDIEILRQRIYINFQFSQVANIVQAFRNRVGEIQELCKILEAAAASDLDWRIEASSAIHLLLSENGRFRAHFVVNLEQIDVNSVSLIFTLFPPISNFLLLLRQIAQ